ncbi:MAG: putative DNA binding domain-containing protein [Synergistaceae bacterium]|jgi:ATP-dependent DNA helicase RecG|nr:putative DNA binding domain-containing protein [Synergistaceae bacterium]
MTPERLKKLLSQGEGWDVEFKECADALSNSVFETVCSFSNRYGGHLLLGVDDGGGLLGVNRNAAKGICNNFINLLNNPQKISPSLFLRLEEVEVDGKLILYAYVPVSSQVELCSNKIYDRSGDADIDVTKSTDLAANLYARKSSLFSEREVFPYVTLDDLRLELIPRVKQMAVSRLQNHPWKGMDDMELFKSAGLYEDDKRTGKKGFNLAGVLLFGHDEVIRSCAPGFMTDCLLRRENIDRYDDRRTIGTNLIDAFGQIMEFISEYTMDRFFLIGVQNVSVRSWIARELVSNILAHREYSSSFLSRVVIEKDRIIAENWNRSQTLGKLDPDNFTPRSKNPLISRFFVNIGYADELGSGMKNLYRYTRIYTNGAEPELVEGDIFRTVIPLTANDPVKTDHSLTNPLNPLTNPLNPIMDSLTDAEKVFFSALLPYFSSHEWIDNTITRECTGASSATVRRHMKRFVDIGVLETRGTTRNRRYRLFTRKGDV